MRRISDGLEPYDTGGFKYSDFPFSDPVGPIGMTGHSPISVERMEKVQRECTKLACFLFDKRETGGEWTIQDMQPFVDCINEILFANLKALYAKGK